MRQRLSLPVVLVVLLVSLVSPVSPVSLSVSVTMAQSDPAPRLDAPTHRQTRTIRPTRDGQPIQLNSFCVAPNGTILAACGGQQQTYRLDANGEYEVVELDEPGGIAVMTVDGQEQAFWTLSFGPTAVNVAPDGSIFAAGGGHIAHLSATGEVLAEARTPNIADMEAFRKQAVEAAQAQRKENAEMYADQVKEFKDQLAELEAIAEADRSDSQKAQLEVLRAQIQAFEQLVGTEAEVDADAAVESAAEVTSVAATKDDVFVCCRSLEGYGYEVWRTDYQLGPGTRVLDGLRGCCGQCDVQCSEDGLVVAENTKFRVATYDRDGKPLDSFGRRDRSSRDGFGSCCNPMNVLPQSDGQVLTAESSIGHIKRFAADGTLIAYIGKAKIGAGCKHFALGVDPQNDRYFMMFEDDGSICVLEPRGSDAEWTEAERMAAEARNGLGEKLVGQWQLPETGGQAKSGSTSVFGALARAFGLARSSDTALGTCHRLAFHADGRFEASGGIFDSYGAEWTWQCVRQDEQKLAASIVADQVDFSPVDVVFHDDPNTITVSIPNANVREVTFVRAEQKPAEPAESS